MNKHDFRKSTKSDDRHSDKSNNRFIAIDFYLVLIASFALLRKSCKELLQNDKSDIQPFLKWAGGKRQLLHEIKKYMPNTFDCYYEPFLGAGAVLFELQPDKAVINDSNFELINCYNVIKNNLEELILDLSTHQHTQEYYYNIRALDRDINYSEISNIKKASRFIFLNRTCFNGLYRVNSKGYFNVPFGKYQNPNFQNSELLKKVSNFLNKNIKICNDDFYTILKDAKKDDFIYLDPPYDPVNQTSSFTSYQAKPFDRHEQVRLKNTFDELNQRGCKIMLSNSSTEFINELYKEYRMIRVQATRQINSKSSSRGKVEELLILNY
jgi:DNA adenine methylase